MLPAWIREAAADPPRECGWRNPMTPKKGLIDLDALREFGNLTTEVEWSDFVVFIGKHLREKSSTWAKEIDGVGHCGLDSNDLNFQDIPGFSTLNPDGTRQNVRDHPTLLHLAINRKERGLNLISAQTGSLKSLHCKSDQRFNLDHVP
jgi:hypothetical protein